MLELGYTPKDLADFGNFHFGIVANGLGFTLESSIVGAGAYQVFEQESGSRTQFYLAAMPYFLSSYGYLLPDSWTAYGIRNGLTAGDNQGDSLSIMEGWNYAKENY